MVIVRIKENEDSKNLKKISDDDIKIITKLKLCKLITTDIDENVAKKIEYLIASKPENNIEYNDSNDEYTIFGFNEQNEQDSGGNKSNKYKPRQPTSNYRFSNWKRNDRKSGKNSYG